MEQVDTMTVVRYWSDVLCCAIVAHLGDIKGEVKVTDFEVFGFSFRTPISS